MDEPYSDYIFYADESGDHSLVSIDEHYPVFVLALCCFNKRTYSRRIVPKFQDLKFEIFGHDSIVLHERDIRKKTGVFAALNNKTVDETFMQRLSDLVRTSSFRIMPVVIDKRLIRSDLFPDHPYHLSLRIALQSAYLFLRDRRQHELRTFFIFEKRGPKEDAELELAFRRIADGENDIRTPMAGFRILFTDKRANATGMQLADLVARPLGLRVVRPDQQNRVYPIIQKKIVRRSTFSSTKRGIFIP